MNRRNGCQMICVRKTWSCDALGMALLYKTGTPTLGKIVPGSVYPDLFVDDCLTLLLPNANILIETS